MASSIPIISSFLLLLIIITSSCNCVQSDEHGYITAQITNTGLDFLKDLLIEKAESELVPLELPEFDKTVNIPVIGSVDMYVSSITIESIHVTSSTLRSGDTGIVIDVSGATANLSMDWEYSYSTWWLPISISDKGNAIVQVEGLEIGLTLSPKNVDGSLKLSLLECGCYVSDISIKLDGGASWFYQGFVDAFADKISSAVEDSVPKKIKDVILKLDSLLQSLPREVSVTSIAALNVTVVGDPLLSNSSLDLEIDGLFSQKNETALTGLYHDIVRASASCNEVDKMAKISLHEDVLRSASSVYFEARKMHWIVDKIPDQSMLNTAWWRFIVPQLYKMYPNRDMNLNISVSSPPTIEVETRQIKAKIPVDMVINVLDGPEVVPVVCISMNIGASIFPEILGNTVAGVAKLDEFTMSLKWSRIGDLHLYLLQTLISATLRTVVVPYVNLKLTTGFQIPAFHGYELRHAQIQCADDWIVICSDVSPAKQYSFI